ncbi:hypothetical protein ACMC56_12030 [Campylobacterota bacterium DY0563]
MKNYLKSIFFKLSYNESLRLIARKIFVYFPNLKMKLKDLRDNSYIPKKIEKKEYSSDFLFNIKKEIEAIREGNR